MIRAYKNKESTIHYIPTDDFGNLFNYEDVYDITFIVKKCPASPVILLQKNHLEMNEDGSIDILLAPEDTRDIPIRPFHDYSNPYVCYFKIEMQDGSFEEITDWFYLEPSSASSEPSEIEIEEKPLYVYGEEGKDVVFGIDTDYPSLIHWIEVKRWWDFSDIAINKVIDPTNIVITASEHANMSGRFIFTIYASANPDDEQEPKYVVKKGYLYFKALL